MSTDHLKDSDIQHILDGRFDDSAKQMHEHLKECALCADHLKEYQILTKALSLEPEWSLPKNFAKKTASRALQTQPAYVKKNFTEFILIPIFLLSALIFAFVFLDWSSMFHHSDFSHVKNLFEQVIFNIAESGLNWKLLPVTALTLFLISVLDRLIAKKFDLKIRH